MKYFLILAAFATAGPLWGKAGMISLESDNSFQETSEKFESILKSKGMKIFAVIDHSKGAKGVGVKLPPTTLYVFGNPKVGAPLMKCTQSLAIDLPQKALIWEDSQKKVKISYNDPQFIADRHKLAGCEEVLKKVSKALSGFAKKAANYSARHMN